MSVQAGPVEGGYAATLLDRAPHRGDLVRAVQSSNVYEVTAVYGHGADRRIVGVRLTTGRENGFRPGEVQVIATGDHVAVRRGLPRLWGTR